jgi:hypothetical protein
MFQDKNVKTTTKKTDVYLDTLYVQRIAFIDP